jgi:hypothetical protein
VGLVSGAKLPQALREALDRAIKRTAVGFSLADRSRLLLNHVEAAWSAILAELAAQQPPPAEAPRFNPDHEKPHIESLRRRIVEQYADHPTGTGHSFGEILCHEIHENGMTFAWLAEKWGLSLATLGELIADHCRRLERMPVVDHEWRHE